jgi:tRNA threonylcarbamoyladenosine biosynthesis protein TsaB
MRALAVDTSTDRTGIVLWEGACIVKRETEGPARHAEHLVPLVDEALRMAGWKKTELELLACCIGPGSFTGVRVGLATIKGMALALGVPIVGVGSLEAMASAARSAGARVTLPLLGAGKGEWYWAAYDAEGALVAGPGHVGARDLASVLSPLLDRDPTIVGDVVEAPTGHEAADEIAALVASRRARVVRSASTDRPDAAEIARLAVQKLATSGADDLHALEPVYVRPPDITWPRSTSTAR